jgi:hypothetical protein
MPEISREAFAAWADSVGVEGDAEHLERLRAEVEGMMGRLAHLDDIDVSEVAPEDAGLRQDGGAAWQTRKI